MADPLTVTINVISYLAGIWIAFQIFDLKKKGKLRSAKDDLLLWSLLLCFALGVGTLFAYLLKAWLIAD